MTEYPERFSAQKMTVTSKLFKALLFVIKIAKKDRQNTFYLIFSQAHITDVNHKAESVGLIVLGTQLLEDDQCVCIVFSLLNILVDVKVQGS